MARPAQGTTVFVDTLLQSQGATPTFTTQVKCPMNIGGIGSGDRTEIEVSTLCSQVKEYILGLKDEGEISMEMPYDPLDPGQALIQTARDATGIANRLSFQINIPADGADAAITFTFEALVLSLIHI